MGCYCTFDVKKGVADTKSTKSKLSTKIRRYNLAQRYERKNQMTKEDILMLTGKIPLTELAFRIHGRKERGINYCVISRYKNDGFIHSKIEHMVTDDLDSLDLNKKSDETSLSLDIDNATD